MFVNVNALDPAPDFIEFFRARTCSRARLRERRSLLSKMSFFFVWSFIFFTSCSNPPPTTSHPELAFSDMTITEYNHGSLVYSAHARTAVGSRHDLDLQDVNIEHRGAKLVGKIAIASKHGHLNIDKGGIEFDQGVNVKDTNGRYLLTEQVTYTPDKQILLIPGKITLSGRDLNMTANRVQGTIDSEQYTLEGPIEGTFITPKK